MPSVGVILAAAGRSQRFGAPTDKKPFVELRGQSVWLYSAELFCSHPDVQKVVLVVSPEDIDSLSARYQAELNRLSITLVKGGTERADSVENGLLALGDEVDLIAVHDAARPCVTRDMIDRAFEAAELHGAAVVGTPVTSTLKRVDSEGCIIETVDRRGTWMSQTPQVAKRLLLTQAFQMRGPAQPTDEAQLLEAAGHCVWMVEGSPLNLKITTPPDLKFAELALQALSG
jgi:2-C-methyl-D-erythritol 4-phosphate cytidylyltransferase